MALSRPPGHVGETHRFSELRIVLLGALESGKSSAGNTILGRDEFTPGERTTQCVTRQGVVARRKVTVVDTPGWWKFLLVEDFARLLKDQFLRSVSLCPPGPHAVLLVIELDSPFQERYRRTIEEHLELLTERVWRHTIVLFTNGNSLGETTIEQHIEREGQALQWVIEKCGNRYHVLSNRNRSEGSQVTELLEKIEEMVAGNGGCHFHMESEVLQEMEEKRRTTEERAKQRAEKVKTKRKKQRETLRKLFRGKDTHLSELRIVLLGWVGAGKSSSGNTILGREEFGAWRRDSKCLVKRGAVAGRRIFLVNTPSWLKYISAELTPDWLKQEVVRSWTLCYPGPHVFLLVFPADTSFKEEQRRIIRDNMKHLGEGVWRHTIVLFTWGDCLGKATIEQHIEREGPALQWVIEKCGNRYHVFNNMKKEDRTQVTELLEKIEEMVAGNSVFDLSGNSYSEMVKEIDETDRHISGADPSTEAQMDSELSRKRVRTIDKIWNRREDELLEKMGLDFVKGPNSKTQTQLQDKVPPPDNFIKLFEKEWSRRTEIKKLRKTSLSGAVGCPQEEKSDPEETDSETQRTKGDDRLCSGSGSDTLHGGEGDDTLEGGFVSQEDDRETQILLSRLQDLLERELNRREVLMMIKMKQMIQECTKEGSIPHPPNMSEGTPSEPDSTDIARSCEKVYDWLRDSHSRDPVGCEMTSEVGDEEHTDCSNQHAWEKEQQGACSQLEWKRTL